MKTHMITYCTILVSAYIIGVTDERDCERTKHGEDMDKSKRHACMVAFHQRLRTYDIDACCMPTRDKNDETKEKRGVHAFTGTPRPPGPRPSRRAAPRLARPHARTNPPQWIDSLARCALHGRLHAQEEELALACV